MPEVAYALGAEGSELCPNGHGVIHEDSECQTKHRDYDKVHTAIINEVQLMVTKSWTQVEHQAKNSPY